MAWMMKNMLINKTNQIKIRLRICWKRKNRKKGNKSKRNTEKGENKFGILRLISMKIKLVKIIVI